MWMYARECRSSSPSMSELGCAECRTSLALGILGMEPALLQTGRWAAPPAVSQMCESGEQYAQRMQQDIAKLASSQSTGCAMRF